MGRAPAVGDLDESQVIEQLTEQGDAGNTSHVVLGRLDHHRCNTLERPCNDTISSFSPSACALVPDTSTTKSSAYADKSGRWLLHGERWECTTTPGATP
ncbi:MAG: hypothetical protein ACYCS7_05975 [Acidimicrobiales bacterium]